MDYFELFAQRVGDLSHVANVTHDRLTCAARRGELMLVAPVARKWDIDDAIAATTSLTRDTHRESCLGAIIECDVDTLEQLHRLNDVKMDFKNTVSKIKSQPDGHTLFDTIRRRQQDNDLDLARCYRMVGMIEPGIHLASFSWSGANRTVKRLDRQAVFALINDSANQLSEETRAVLNDQLNHCADTHFARVDRARYSLRLNLKIGSGKEAERSQKVVSGPLFTLRTPGDVIHREKPDEENPTLRAQRDDAKVSTEPWSTALRLHRYLR
ncbi:hypothetical protein [uncultured Umboniibacter sp.]|uniref:hypothetical protein n=1 Tax=uncultured Umboniibacter sp. TaxID=1798917 RepID=UPI002606D49D|nr:hypothetical protein [uncultured Umboniibacter sp.]